jgi:hypothetical protein
MPYLAGFQKRQHQRHKCEIAGIDENFAPNMGAVLLEGTFPKRDNELMMEQWAAEKFGLKPGETVSLTFEDNSAKTFVLSGIFSDYGTTKAAGERGCWYR